MNLILYNLCILLMATFCYQKFINIKLSSLQHCLRRIPLSGTPIILHQRINYFKQKGSRYSLPPPRLLETGENSLSSFFSLFFSLAYFSELRANLHLHSVQEEDSICIVIVSVLHCNFITSFFNQLNILAEFPETRASMVIITSQVGCN